MAGCIRYWRRKPAKCHCPSCSACSASSWNKLFSRESAEGLFSPSSAAASSTIGGSCRSSPTRITRSALTSGTRTSGTVARPASSTMAQSKLASGICLPPLYRQVAATTLDCSTIRRCISGVWPATCIHSLMARRISWTLASSAAASVGCSLFAGGAAAARITCSNTAAALSPVYSTGKDSKAAKASNWSFRRA